MDRSDWSQLRSLFEHALQLDVRVREEWLFANAPPHVASQVIELLRADASAHSLLDAPLPTVELKPLGPNAARFQPRETESPVEGVIGEFAIRGVLGEGRSGIVYRAWQPHPPREVALKVLRASVWSDAVARRFETEVRALARLSHPGIAKVFTTGLLHEPGGVERPYFAMELVEGARTIRDAAHDLQLADRLVLVHQACEAVAHAHQHGVLHRDLKPCNLLVGRDGLVRVIDFGIARLVEDAPGLTLTGQLLGTPGYMSPEQSAGMESDTRSDIYALGVIIREVLGADAPRDACIMVKKATATHAADRYQSASELALELLRLMRGQPIAARPPSSLELLRTFLQRHAAFALAVLIASLGLLAGGVSFVVSSIRLVEAEQATVYYLLDNVLHNLEGRLGTLESRRRLAHEILAKVESYARRSPDDLALSAFARSLYAVQNVERESACYDVALPHATRELEIRDQLSRAAPDDPARSAALSLAIVRVGDLHGAMGRTADQRSHYERAMAIDRRLYAEDPNDVHHLSNLAYSCQRLSDLALRSGDVDVAERLAREQVQLAMRWLAREPNDPVALWEATDAGTTLAVTLMDAGHVTDAISLAREQVVLTERMWRLDPGSRKFALRRVSVLGWLSYYLALGGQFDEADAPSSTALALAERTLKADPEDHESRVWVALSLMSRARVLAGLDQLPESIELNSRSIRMLRDAVAARGLTDELLGYLVRVCKHQASLVARAGRTGDADGDLREVARATRGLATEIRGLSSMRLERLHDVLAHLSAPTEDESAERVVIVDLLASRHEAHVLARIANTLEEAQRTDEAVRAAELAARLAKPEQEHVRRAALSILERSRAK